MTIDWEKFLINQIGSQYILQDKTYLKLIWRKKVVIFS